jgi:DNA-binding MarR family transcriptional regulator
VSSKRSTPTPGLSEPIPGRPEPDPFRPAELAVWRAMLRSYEWVTRELDRRLRTEHDLSFDAYGVLITLVTEPGGLAIGELGERRNLSPSGISRAVDRVARDGLVERRPNPIDQRSFVVALTDTGLQRLRSAQVTHHALVRERLLGRLDDRQLEQFAELWEAAVPGSVTSKRWPPPTGG